jgi:hypothetical protein
MLHNAKVHGPTKPLQGPVRFVAYGSALSVRDANGKLTAVGTIGQPNSCLLYYGKVKVVPPNRSK